MKLLENIPVHLDLEEVLKQLGDKEGKHAGVIHELLGIANSLVKPRAIYEVSYVGDQNGDTVYIDGVKFTSRILRTNLDGVGRVFPYIVTIGKELENKAASFDDLLKQFFMETIGDVALRSTVKYLEDYLKKRYLLIQLSRMNPGSLKDWPIEQQTPLFSIFRDVEKIIGVRLTDSLLMVPRKSVSGIFFPTEVEFSSCQLCPREGCKYRRAPYDKGLKEKYGIEE